MKKNDKIEYVLFIFVIMIGMPSTLMGQTTIIPPTYEKVRGFSDGLAAVCKSGKWGYINLRGDEVIVPQYAEVGDFHEDLAAVCVDERWGFIDKKNTFVISPKYYAAHPFSCGLAAVAIEKASCGEDVYSYSGANKDSWVYIDKKGNIPSKKKYLYAYSYNNGYACVYGFINFNKELYYIDKNGQNVFSTGTDIPFRYSNSLIPKLDKNTGFLGYSDIEGTWVLEPQYSSVSEFIDGLAVVGKFTEGNTVINTVGETVFSGNNPTILSDGYIYDNKKLYCRRDYKSPCFIGDVESSISYYPYEVIQNNLYGYNALIYNQEHQKVINVFQPSDGLFGAFFFNSLYGFVTFDIKDYINQYVGAQIGSWLKRGEFESTSAYESRTSEANRQQKMVYYADDLINNWLKKGLDEWTLSEYDADKECFELSTDLGKYNIKIPTGSARMLKSNWSSTKKQVGFKYDNGLSLAKIDFIISLGNKDVTLSVNTATGTIEEDNHDNINKELPSIKWLEFMATATNKDCPIKLGVNSKSKIESVTITVNGIQDRGIKTINNSDFDLTISRTLTLNEGENLIKVSVTNAAGTAQEEKTIVYRPQGGELPSIEWLDFAATANKKEYLMKLGIKSKSKVEEVNVTVNGELTRGIKTVASDGYDLTVNRTLSLSEGLNRIVVSVRNGDGISTSEKVITYQGNNPTPVFNDKRIALVIGNSEYQGNINSLANPRNDAEDITSKLKSLGFEVNVLYDGTKQGMKEAINSFVVQARNYDVALFYYAGHGLQLQTDIGGANYLIPVDANLVYKSDAEHDCVNANRIVSQMEASGCKVRLVVLDACRDLPNLLDSNRGTSPTGFSEIKSVVGTYILYSTREGKTASDGKGRNSPFAEGILKYIDVPNQPVERFFKNVGAWVDQVTNNKQNPWPSGRINGDFYFNKQ